jgi:HPt (histidine-containing phosphotransfer) domain-containing protein
MTIQECYAVIGGDYEGVLARLRKEERVARFALMFLKDDSYAQLLSAVQEGSVEEAFRAAHTLKGVCQNIGFDRLHRSTDEITEALRGGDMDRARLLLPQVMEDYNVTAEGLRTYEAARE